MNLYKSLTLTGIFGAIWLILTLLAGVLNWPLIVHRLLALATLVFIGLHAWFSRKIKQHKK